MLGSIFSFWFKHEPLVFARGDLAFASPLPVAALLLAGLGGALAIVAYTRRAGALEQRHRVILAGARIGLLAVMLFALSRPVLRVRTVTPQENVLAVLIDDSRSMQVADLDGRPRSTFIPATLGPDGALRPALAKEFKLRFFRFAGGTERIADVGELGFAGTETDLAQALDRVRRELSAVPLAGIVVITDGADNGAGSLHESTLQLKATKVPVYAVGVGRDAFARDLELARIETPPEVLKGSSVVVDVLIAQRGYAGRTVQLNVEDEGRLVATRPVRLEGSSEATTARVAFTLTQPGPRRIRFRIPPEPDEQVAENNARESLIVVAERREKVLYFEGEPRFEVKFLRRAVAEDANLQLVVLQRTAEGKFLRLDVDDAEELAAGFPKTRAELFTYRALILGSVEASFFTHDQLQMLADFVRQRGGGLLLLGGRRAFSEGGYAETPLADALPVLLERRGAADTVAQFHEITMELTPAGATHPALQIAGDLEANAQRWKALPPLSTVNPLVRAKPGATTLLRGVGPSLNDPVIGLAFQRYGRGKTVAFPVQDSWIWQMHASIPLEDLTHETLWRQLLRWLVSGVPERVGLSVGGMPVVGRDLEINAQVADSGYLGVNGATVRARVQSPSGEERDLLLEWNLVEDGAYRTRFVPDQPGLYAIRVEAEGRGGVAGVASGHAYIGEPTAEYFGATMRRPALERLATETGGRFYRWDDVASLPDDVRYTESGVATLEEHELWDMPIVLLLLLGLVATEWGMRRARGLA